VSLSAKPTKLNVPLAERFFAVPIVENVPSAVSYIALPISPNVVAVANQHAKIMLKPVDTAETSSAQTI